MDDLLTNLLTDSVTEKVTDVVVEQAMTTPVDTSLWGVVDIMLDTGAAEGIAGALGAPLAIIIGIKVFRQWRRKMKQAEKQNG